MNNTEVNDHITDKSKRAICGGSGVSGLNAPSRLHTLLLSSTLTLSLCWCQEFSLGLLHNYHGIRLSGFHMEGALRQLIHRNMVLRQIWTFSSHTCHTLKPLFHRTAQTHAARAVSLSVLVGQSNVNPGNPPEWDLADYKSLLHYSGDPFSVLHMQEVYRPEASQGPSLQCMW